MSNEMGAMKWEWESTTPLETWIEETSPETDAALDETLQSAHKHATEDLDEEEPSILNAALNRAEAFLQSQSRQMKKAIGYFPPSPRISPGPKGSADLRWELPNGGLLVNVPANHAHATYYGELDGTTTKGSFNPISWNLVIYTWLNKK